MKWLAGNALLKGNGARLVAGEEIVPGGQVAKVNVAVEVCVPELPAQKLRFDTWSHHPLFKRREVGPANIAIGVRVAGDSANAKAGLQSAGNTYETGIEKRDVDLI